jgi:uncharacterized protein YsxB (DUF464 family)
MIKIQSSVLKHTVTVTGHATNGKDNNPLVCAGISALVSGLAQNVRFCEDVGQVKRTPVIKLKEGNAKISCKPKKAHESTVIHLFMVFDMCFRQMQAQFPDLIEFNGDEF